MPPSWLSSALPQPRHSRRTAPEGALAGTADSTAKPITATATGLRHGKIKNVWLIILQDKSHDATFTGLNQNSYL